MTTPRYYPPLTTDQRDALQTYAETHGRTWKQQLRDEWMQASTSGPLQQLRNTHGPSWLTRYQLPARQSDTTPGSMVPRCPTCRTPHARQEDADACQGTHQEEDHR